MIYILYIKQIYNTLYIFSINERNTPPPPPEQLQPGQKVILTDNYNQEVRATIETAFDELYMHDEGHPEGYYAYNLKLDIPKPVSNNRLRANGITELTHVYGYSFNVKKIDTDPVGGSRKTRKRKLKNRKSKRRRRASK